MFSLVMCSACTASWATGQELRSSTSALRVGHEKTLSRLKATAAAAISPPRRTRIDNALLLGSRSVGSSEPSTTWIWTLSSEGILAASGARPDVADERLRGPKRQLVARSFLAPQARRLADALCPDPPIP